MSAILNKKAKLESDSVEDVEFDKHDTEATGSSSTDTVGVTMGDGSRQADSHSDTGHSSSFKFSDGPSLDEIRQLQSEFCRERNWDQYHQPRNLMLALVGEVGELAEIFQWRGEVQEGLPGWSEKDKKHVGQELSDCMIYLVRLAEKCHVDLPAEVLNKMELNRLKYPAGQVYGSSKKYTEYKTDGNH